MQWTSAQQGPGRCQPGLFGSARLGAYKEWLTCGKHPADEGWAYMSKTCELVVWNCTRAADRLSPCPAFRPPNVAMPLHSASVLAGQQRLRTQPPRLSRCAGPRHRLPEQQMDAVSTFASAQRRAAKSEHRKVSSFRSGAQIALASHSRSDPGLGTLPGLPSVMASRTAGT